MIHICIVGRAFRRGFYADGVPIIKGAGMTIKDLNKLPCFEYKQAAAVAAAATATATTTTVVDCAVCLDSFEVGDYCRTLPNCHHYFHVQCVDVWLIKTPFCPVCRTCTITSVTMVSPKVGSNVVDAGRNASSANVADDLC
ncbi:hypothetical protein SOVF_131380 [Spinacia oleracea]|nr:hypothetical protein SOVF_131380 [Spinacia oleracea]